MEFTIDICILLFHKKKEITEMCIVVGFICLIPPTAFFPLLRIPDECQVKIGYVSR